MEVLSALDDIRAIDQLAQRCANWSRRRGRCFDMAFHELADEARSAILERVAAAHRDDESLNESDLFGVGTRALADLAWAFGRKDRGTQAARYWADVIGDHGIEADDDTVPLRVRTLSDPFSGPLIERIALTEVFDALSVEAQETIVVFAAHDNRLAASAEHLGICRQTMGRRVRRARQEFFDAWFDWEPAPPVPKLTARHENLSTHCRLGHEYTPENTKWTREQGHPRRWCRACEAQKNQARKAARAARRDSSS